MHRSILVLLAFTTIASAQPRSPVVCTREKPVRAVETAPGHWFIDFGKDGFGNVEITAPAGALEANATVDLGEAVSSPDTVNRSPGGTVRFQEQPVTLLPGKTNRPALTWAPPGWMKSGWLNRPAGMPEVMPFRYVEITGAPAWFSTNHIRRTLWTVPFHEDASGFNSSSPALNGVWDLCQYTIKATSFLGLYVDGDRERRPYEADALINQLGHYCVDDRYDTARLTTEYLLKNPTWPTEWHLQTIMLAWNDYLWSGDDTLLRQNYDQLKRHAWIDRRTPDGLFRGDKSDIVDWPAGERDGYDMSVAAKTVVTAFHYHALMLLEKIARHLGRAADANMFAGLARTTYNTVNARLWDASRGCYLDGLDPDTGKKSPHASAHANFFPLALGLVPPDRVARVAAFIKSRGMVCSVYGAQFLIEALYDAGEAQAALDLLTTNQLRSWRNMSEKIGSTMTLEAWDPSLKSNLDWNHAWGAAPANLIPRELMGIEPLQPGFTRFRVRPQIASLTWASVKVPTPKGSITLSIHRPAGNLWQAKIVVPPGTVAEFQLPPHQPDSLQLSSGKPRVLRAENGREVIELSAGTNTLSLSTK
jgi:hypothetical protein